MTPLEQHIQIDQDLQRIGSYVYDDFLPEEKDIILNKMQDRFIDDKIKRDPNSEGFQVDQIDLDNLRNVLVEDIELPVYVDIVKKQGFVIFPDDYRYLINDRSMVYRSCLSTTNSEYNVLDVDSVTTLSTSILSFNNTTDTESPYSEVILQFNGEVIFNSADYPPLADGLAEPEQRFTIINLILDQLRQDKPNDIVGIYWEQFDKTFKRNSFIIVSNIPTASSSLTVDGNTENGVTTVVDGLFTSSNIAEVEVPNRLTKTEVVRDVLKQNHYTKTISRSPISNIAGNRLYVHFNESFIPTKVTIDYIRIPRKISLSLDISCELAETTHQKLCDLAVEFIKNAIEQPSYETKLKDNLLRSE